MRATPKKYLQYISVDEAETLNSLPKKREPKVKNYQRNKPCPCGSGKKFKKCCMWKVKKALRR